VSDSGRRCGALRSRAREQGLSSVRRRITAFCLLEYVRADLFNDEVAASVVVLVRLRLVDEDFGVQAVCLVYILVACVRCCLLS
jgi:hypothetical protein